MSTLKEQAYETLLERIQSGWYKPGAQLNRRDVAQELGMSTAPVHEAMLQLEHVGLVEAIPRRGTRVRSINREDMWNHLVVREALECQAARLICGAPVQAAYATLLPLAEATDNLGCSEEEHASHEVIFHSALVELAGCPPLSSHYQQTMQVGAFYRASLLLTDYEQGLVDLHVPYLESLTVADPQAAEQTVRHHIWAGKPDWFRDRRFGHQAPLTR